MQALSFLLDYRQLRWGSRLAVPDYLYHSGRLWLFLLVVLLPFLGIFTLVPNMNEYVMAGWVAIPAVYSTYIGIKLAVMRLHDFNLAGWWLLVCWPIAVFDYYVLSQVAPVFTEVLGLTGLIALAMFFIPASSAENKFGAAGVNSTQGKSMLVRLLPLLLFALPVLGVVFKP